MQYMEYDQFGHSLRTLYNKGGPFRKAAEDVLAMLEKAKRGFSFDQIFAVGMTHSGENRLPYCRKYDLVGRARLVTVVNHDICMFLFAGDHTTADHWLDKNRGIDFIAKKVGDGHVIEPVFVSDKPENEKIIQTGVDLGAPDNLLGNFSEKYVKKLLKGVPDDLRTDIVDVGPMASDDYILQLADRIESEPQKLAVIDVILLLREGNVVAAKNRTDLFSGEVKAIAELNDQEASQIISGDRVVRIEDVDQQLFEHFVKTADFQQWMLYLHPTQREFVTRDFAGPARMAGVSGSGKTCVLIHRALRLAEKYSDKKVLVLTLNASLVTLIDGLIKSSTAGQYPINLRVASFWEICRELLCRFEPYNKLLYAESTAATNPYAASEHIEEIWDEYYRCENNNHDAMVLWPLHQSLLGRGIFPQDYVKQEFDYIRSALAPSKRSTYASMERKGRIVPLDANFRSQIIDGLAAWESKMRFVGAVDAMGVAAALVAHLEKLDPEYRCILVDEVQDFGTIELSIIRRLAEAGENDLFLCGDVAQSVYTKIHGLPEAQIAIGNRYVRLNQNYRNSRQILTAAHQILQSNYNSQSKELVDLEIINPEYANFSSAKPLVLSAENLEQELAYAKGYCDAVCAGDQRAKLCIALAGFSLRSIERIGEHLKLPVLRGDTTLNSGQIFLSDLEQTKGFEFDRVVVVNCTSKVIPHPDLPVEEAYRDLCKLYVAMTRAKSELIISYHGELSKFISPALEHFVYAEWADGYAERAEFASFSWPAPSVATRRSEKNLKVTAIDFLRSAEAVGLPTNVQQKLIECVTGSVLFSNINKSSKQKTWATIDDFMRAMETPLNRGAVKLSDEAWETLRRHLDWRPLVSRDVLSLRKTPSKTFSR